MQGSQRVLGVLAASLDDKLPEPVSMEQKMQRLRELQILIENMPLEMISTKEMFQILGYVLNVLLRIIDGSYSQEYRKTGAKTIKSLLGRHSSDEFLVSVMPGTCTTLLKFLSGWEKEPVDVSKTVIECMGILLIRAYRRAEEDGKIAILLNRLSGLCSSMRFGAVSVEYTKMLLSILSLAEKLKDDKVLLPIIRGLAIMRQSPVVSTFLTPKTLQLAVLALDHSVDFFTDSTGKNATARHLDEIRGLCEFIPTSLWARDLVTVCKSILSNILKQITFPTFLHSLDEWGWESEIGKSMAELLKTFKDFGVSFELDDNFPTFEHLLCFGRVNRGSLEVVDKLIRWFDESSSRELGHSVDDLTVITKDENLWHLSWCSAVNCIIWEDELVDYFIRPILGLAASSSVPVQEAARTLGHKIAKTRGFKSFDEMVGLKVELLQSQISADLRYPALFPHAPSVLAELIKLTKYSLHATALLDTIKELEHRAPEYQKYSGYSLLLLRALSTLMSVFKSGETLPPKDPKNSDNDEEPLNQPMTIEEELTDASIKVAVHFLTSDEERVRIEALQVLNAACQVFKKPRSSVFLPLVHHTWKPILSRLGDPSLSVAKLALRTIRDQAMVAGEFMADRVQKELLPIIGKHFARESSTIDRSSSVPVMVDLLQCLERVSTLTVRNMANLLLSPSIGILNHNIVTMMKGLAEIDADQVWFVLMVKHGGCKILSHPSGLFPDIRLEGSNSDPLLVEQCLKACAL